MKDSARFVKMVEWSEEDQCYIGSAPGLIMGGCHGSDEKAVFAELCQIVEEAIELYKADGKKLPPPTCGKDFANRLLKAACKEQVYSGNNQNWFEPMAVFLPESGTKRTASRDQNAGINTCRPQRRLP